MRNERTKEIISWGTRGYFEVDKQRALANEHGAARALNHSVNADRVVPRSFLASICGAAGVGAWLNDLNGTDRGRVTIAFNPVLGNLSDYCKDRAAMIHPSTPS